jgi:hypothetical protein
MTLRVSPAQALYWTISLFDQPLAELADSVGHRSGLPRFRLGSCVLGRAAVLCVLLCLPLLGGCEYVEKARRTSDLVVTTSQFYKVEALVQANIERRRLRSARCYSPLLTPATISAAAVDSRLGPSWVDELLRDCPQFAAFLSELTLRRGLSAGLLPPRDAVNNDREGADAGSSSPLPLPSPAVDDTATAEPPA